MSLMLNPYGDDKSRISSQEPGCFFGLYNPEFTNSDLRQVHWVRGPTILS